MLPFTPDPSELSHATFVPVHLWRNYMTHVVTGPSAASCSWCSGTVAHLTATPTLPCLINKSKNKNRIQMQKGWLSSYLVQIQSNASEFFSSAFLNATYPRISTAVSKEINKPSPNVKKDLHFLLLCKAPKITNDLVLEAAQLDAFIVSFPLSSCVYARRHFYGVTGTVSSKTASVSMLQNKVHRAIFNLHVTRLSPVLLLLHLQTHQENTLTII